MIYLALSCLQGRPMQTAFDTLAPLADGIQLTPGNVPTPGFALHVARSGVPIRTHHGFAWTTRLRPVWPDDGACLTAAMSVHPPEGDTSIWEERMATDHALWPLVEVMYPGEALGDDAAVTRAMDLGVRLAVDISHMHIQRTQGAMSDATWRRLMDYPHIGEVHVSANDGRSDAHRPVTPETFGLDWAKAKSKQGVPLVLECYMHRLDEDARRRQIDIVRGAA